MRTHKDQRFCSRGAKAAASRSTPWSARACSRLGALFAPPVMLLMLTLSLVHAFPPAPHHTFYGTVKDQRGKPLDARNAKVVLVTPAGGKVTTRVIPGMEPGQNYRLRIPMDAGLTQDLYKPTAMRPTMPFRLRVVVGREVFLPIEINAETGGAIGGAGGYTHLDLTLGEDLDGDGIPDAWERSLISRGLGDDLASIKPEDDADGDGLSNLAEYLAGSHAYDGESGFDLVIRDFREGVPVMGFMALPGRSYEVLGSTDLNEWQSVSFRLTSDEQQFPLRDGLYSEGVTEVEIEVPSAGESLPYQFFKLQVK